MTKPIPHPESRFTVLWQVEDYERNNGRRYSQWLCQCECGKTCKVASARIRDGHVKSCGCLHRETARKNGLKTAHIARAAYQEKARRKREANAATT
jgi:hypothetical protein